MARQRHAVNPAKVKAQISALEAHPPTELFQRRLDVRRRLGIALLSLLGAVLLTISFAPFDFWYVCYVALVPWVLSLSTDTHGRWSVLCAWLSGLLFWLANLYWLWWVTLVGYALMALYLSAYWLVAALVLRSSIRRNWPMWIVLPVLWVALEFVRAYVISGFPWFYLAHSQYAQARLIQIADVTGQYGVSFFVAMVNGALVDLLNSPLFVRTRSGPRLGRQCLCGVAACAGALAALLGYGTWRLNQQTLKPGPVIGICQQAFGVSLRRRAASQEQIFQSHLDAAGTLIGAGCDLVLFPESMLPTGVNPDFLTRDFSQLSPLYLTPLVRRAFPPEARRGYSDRMLMEDHYLPYLREQATRTGEMSRRLGCPILAGGVALKPNPAPSRANDYWLRYNSALWFDATGELPAGPAATQGAKPLWMASPRYYSKVHLVPFGEYVPFRQSWPWLHRFLRSFVPGVMDQLEPGTEFVTYKLSRPPRKAGGGPPGPVSAPTASQATAPATAERTWRLAVPICYEGTFARVCRAMVRKDGRKSVDVLVNLSNDGWFIWQFAGGGIHRSTEHAQHLAHYCFRAVESRVPVVRAVNTGISASIDSNGRIRSQLTRGRIRTMIAGNLLLDGREGQDQDYAQHGPLVLVDSRVTVYSLVGDVFALLAVAGAVAIIGRLAIRRRRAAEGVVN